MARKNSINRVALLLAFLLVLVLARSAAGAESLRVGYLGPLTGIFAQAGKDMLDGNIELIAEDSEGNPGVERDRLPTLFLTTPDDLTKRRPTRWVLRSNFSASQPMHALGHYAATVLKYKRIAAIAMDNGFGHEGIGGFQRVFENQGGRVVQKIAEAARLVDGQVEHRDTFLAAIRQASESVEDPRRGYPPVKP